MRTIYVVDDVENGQPKPAAPQAEPESAEFAEMRESLRHGVQVVAAPQLFPTPPEVAARMVELADIQPDSAVLEPSAGTGRLLDALLNADGTGWKAAPVSRLVAGRSRQARRARAGFQSQALAPLHAR